MDNPENNLGDKENPAEDNRAEMIAWLKKWREIQLDKKSKREPYDSHANYHLNLEDLLPRDVEIWIKMKEGIITARDIVEWRKELDTERPKDQNSEDYPKWTSRHTFYLLAANLATSIIGFKQMGIEKNILNLE